LVHASSSSSEGLGLVSCSSGDGKTQQGTTNYSQGDTTIMNHTRDYEDQLDGGFLACHPLSMPEELAIVCNILMPTIGWMLNVTGLFQFYLAAAYHSNRMRIRRMASTPSTQANVRVSHMERVLLSAGATTIFVGAGFLVYGFGTVYPTSHIRGQIGDAVCKFVVCQASPSRALFCFRCGSLITRQSRLLAHVHSRIESTRSEINASLAKVSQRITMNQVK
jgi:hypothetical protein